MTADTASLFSDTSTLYDVPILTGDSTGGLLPVEDCFLVLFIHHDHFKVDPDQLTRAGLPSIYDKSNNPSGTRSTLAKINLKKERLQVQFTKASIQHATIDRKEAITTLNQANQMIQGRRSSIGRMMTMFDSLEDELVGIQTRRIMDIVLSVLFKSRDVRNPILFYPANSVLLTPNWAVSKERGMATSEAQWATITFLSPAKSVSNESEEDAKKRYFDSLTQKETDQEVLDRLFVPDEESEASLQRLLKHLESRGTIWSKAGHATRPSIKNSDPKRRSEFVVLGLFPAPFVNRCKAYHRKGDPMPSDLQEDGKSKYAPLITTLGGRDHKEQDASSDYLEGWTIRHATDEPYRTGSAREDAYSAGIGIGYATVGLV